jgi:DNA-directed RNA polymerase
MPDGSTTYDFPPNSGEMMVKQFKLEMEMLDGGLSRFQRQEEKADKRGELNTGGRYFLRRMVDPVTAAVAAFLKEAATGGPGRRHTAAPYIEECGAEEAAYLALRACLGDFLANREEDYPRVQAVAVSIGASVETELWMRAFKKARPDLFAVTMAELSKHRGTTQRRSIARRMSRKAEVAGEWGERTRFLVGMKLLETVRAVTGLFDFATTDRGTRREALRLVVREEARERMTEVREAASHMSPLFMPTIVPPKPWSSTRTGGYHSGLFRRLWLVKTWAEGTLEEMDATGAEAVLSAVNAVQATPWRINVRVLEVLEECLNTERSVAGLPGREVDVPPFPPGADHDPELKLHWRRAAGRAYEENRKNLAKRVQTVQATRLARRFSEYPAIYFPHQMDFRGRIYPMPILLNPQGPDYVKGLLTFARGYPIADERAAGWLMISGANHYGVDKVSLQDRIEWVQRNEEAVLAVDADPWGPAFSFWSEADAPFQFLAWCFEYAAFKRHGFGFVSSLPVALDGTCNGLQHYSAALRDPEGGAAVNLVPGDKPSDIYAKVAERTLTLVREFVRPDGPDTGIVHDLNKHLAFWAERGINPREMAERWLEFGIDRKITKRSVMTLPYGSTNFSSRGFLEDAIGERAAKSGAVSFTDAVDMVERRRAFFNASLWLQPLVWQAIGETVRAARDGMAWLQECARLVAALDLPITWTTPDGFLVQQAYRDTDQARIKTIVDGSVIRLTLATYTNKVDRRAQQQGVAPNWVHSMDACALRMFVNMAVDNGLEDFALVHDSYGAPAAKVDLMVGCLKESFIGLYQDHDPVLMFYFDMQDQLSEKLVDKLPKPPAKGSLDVSGVRESDYFFA